MSRPNAGRHYEMVDRGNFWFYISGLPLSWRYQELKDLVREVAPHIGWADIETFPGGKSKGCGWVTIKSRQDADRLYDFLKDHVYDSRRLFVRYFDITRDPAIVLKSNFNTPNDVQCFSSLHAPTNLSMPIWPDSELSLPVSRQVLAHLPTGIPVFPPGAVLMFPLSVGCGQLVPLVSASFLAAAAPAVPAVPAQTPRHPVYSAGPDGTPVNTRMGYVETEARGIFISELNFSTTRSDLEKLLRKAGYPTKCEVQTKGRNGKSAGTATAQFATGNEARRAVEKFDQTVFMDHCLKVRLDRNTDAKVRSLTESLAKLSVSIGNTPQPLILNGSTSVATLSPRI